MCTRVFSIPYNSFIVFLIGIPFCAEEQYAGIFIKSKFLLQICQFRIGHDLCHASECCCSTFSGDHTVISFCWITKNTHSLCCHIVRAGNKVICVIGKDLPSDTARFATCKTCHDGVHITGHKMTFAVICFCGTIQAVCLVRFYNGNHRSVFAIDCGE